MSGTKRLVVLDTNVLMHDPTSLFRFDENDVYLPMVVLEELDHAKTGVSEAARNVRQVCRLLDQLISGHTHEQIAQGLPLCSALPQTPTPNGKLIFQTQNCPIDCPEVLPGNQFDNTILACAIALQRERPDTQVTLISKDINLRIKAAVIGICAEDYYNGQTISDSDVLFNGILELPTDYWPCMEKTIDCWESHGSTFYKFHDARAIHWHPNQCLIINRDNPLEAIVRKLEQNWAIVEQATDYTQAHHTVWGVSALNREQNFALNLLMDPELDFVSLMGVAGSGKTLLTLAAGLAQTLDERRYREIIMTRVTVPVGEDIGFLPGTEEEKMTPWMGALMDNLEVLTQTSEGGDWGRAATKDLLRNCIKIRSLNFMRGRTFVNRYVIIDEAQNLTPKQMKTLITRSGPGSKIVCIGNIAQIDTPYLTETTSGLTYVVNHFKAWMHSGHITLRRGERSRLADFASKVL